jgi:hypothetical protein
MASEGLNSAGRNAWPLLSPWQLTLAGATACFLAVFLSHVNSWIAGVTLDPVLVPVRVLLIFVGLVLAGAGVSLRLRTATGEFEERAVSAALTSVAAFTVILGYLALDPAWDSIALLFGVLTVVAFAGVGLILLPRMIRRIVFLVLVLFHFGGILTAVTSAPPPGSDAPWITRQMWTCVYRPYLQFMYLNNAYHFYSPEPGPACQLWFYVKFTDGTGEWLKIPDRKDYSTHQEYQRILSVTESTNQCYPQPPPDPYFTNVLLSRRYQAGSAHKPAIQMAPNLPAAVQYRRPYPSSALMVQSYARYVAKTFKSSADPEKEVATVKVYRVIHHIIPAPEFANYTDPNDPTYFWPYFQGEFNAEGEMLTQQREFNAEGVVTKEDDPFLYWLIPIMDEPKSRDAPFQANLPPNANTRRAKFDVVDYCKIHAEGSNK